jgi:ribosomal protein S18 acetylase RimI-like enzyme
MGRQTGRVLDLQPAVAGDAEDLHLLREAAARWLVERGIRQWLPGEVDLWTIREQIQAGEWFLHRRAERVVVALRFLWSDPEFWGEQPDDAAYVHGLMIERRHAGEGLGAAALRWAEERARHGDRTFLRLDHAADNPGLARYYRKLGFVDGGRREAEKWGPVLLVEKVLTRKTPEVDDLRGSPGTTGTR